MIHRIFIILLILLVLTDTYIYRTVIKEHIRKRSLRILYLLPSVLLTIALLMLLPGDNFTRLRVMLTGWYIIAYLVIVVPKCLYVLFSLLGRAAASVKRLPCLAGMGLLPIQTMFNIIGTIAACAGAFIVIYGCCYGWRKFEVKEVSFSHKDVPPAFDGYRIVQISDLHLGTISRYPETIAKAVETINAQQPDLIAFTGDLVNNEAVELEGIEEILCRLQAKDGVFSVLGNHDYAPYRKWPSKREQAENLADLKRREARMGWQLLLNDNRILYRDGDSIAIVGVENDGKPPFPALGDLPKATRGTEGMFCLLLSHDPSHWKRRVLPETDIPLMLAGHTHAMQFRFGNFSPARWFYPEWGGMYTCGEQSLYVNQGIGSVMFPFRFGAWPEITVITLHSQKKEEKM